jgi:Icc protein
MPITLPPISRRRFLQGAVAAAGALAIGPRVFAAESPADPNHLALFSDIHLPADSKLIHKTKISMWENFCKVRDEVLALESPPVALLINGDCAYLHGKPADYVTVLNGLKPIRQAGLPVHLGLGNHDSRADLLAALGADDRRVEALADKRAAMLSLPHADWYILDTLEKTDTTPGTLGAEQLAWLAKSLDARADRPAVIMMHHQPDSRPLDKRSGLTDTPEFLEMVQPRKQVKAVLFGHTHVWKHYEKDGLHFINLPTTAYVFDPAQPAGWVDARVKAKSMALQLHAITPDHPMDKETLDLKWRA